MTSPALFRQDLRRDYPLVKCGKGPYLFDSNDRKLLDATSGGVMVANIGHGVLEVIEAGRGRRPHLLVAERRKANLLEQRLKLQPLDAHLDERGVQPFTYGVYLVRPESERR